MRAETPVEGDEHQEPQMRVTIIAAVAKNRAIGLEGRIPWRLPADMAFFKRTTMGHTLVMGRETFESTGALPGRTTVVLTRRRGYQPVTEGDRPDRPVRVAHDLDEALRRAEAAGEAEVFVCGGAGVYREALERADRMLLTRVEGEFEADTFFPPFDEGRWREVAREDHEPDERNRHRYSFVEYERAV